MQGTTGVNNSKQSAAHNNGNHESRNEATDVLIESKTEHQGMDAIFDMAVPEVATIVKFRSCEQTLMPMFDRNIVEGLHNAENQLEPIDRLGIIAKVVTNSDGECILQTRINSGPFKINTLTESLSETYEKGGSSQAFKILKERYNIDESSSAEEILTINDEICEALAKKTSQPLDSSLEDIRVNLLLCLSKLLEKKVTPELQKHILKKDIPTLLEAMNAGEPKQVKGIGDIAKYVAHSIIRHKESSINKLKQLEIDAAALMFKKEPFLLSGSKTRDINTLMYVLSNKINEEIDGLANPDSVNLTDFLTKTFTPKSEDENESIRIIARRFNNSFHDFRLNVLDQNNRITQSGYDSQPTMEENIKISFSTLSKRIFISQDELNFTSDKISNHVAVQDWPKIEASSTIIGPITTEDDIEDKDNLEFHELCLNQMRMFFSDERISDINERILEIKKERTSSGIDQQTLKRLNRELFELEGLKSDAKYISRAPLEVGHPFKAADITKGHMFIIKMTSILDIVGAVESITSNSKARTPLQSAVPKMVKVSIPAIVQAIAKEIQAFKINNPVLTPSMAPPLLIFMASIIASAGGGSGGGSSSSGSISANIQAYVKSLQQILLSGQSSQQIMQQVTHLMSTVLPNNQAFVSYATGKISSIIVAQNIGAVASNISKNKLPPGAPLKLQGLAVATALAFGLISFILNAVQFRMSKKFYAKIMQLISDNDIKIDEINKKLNEIDNVLKMMTLSVNEEKTELRMCEDGGSVNQWKQRIKSDLDKSIQNENRKCLAENKQIDVNQPKEVSRYVDESFKDNPEKLISGFFSKKLHCISSDLSQSINKKIDTPSGESSISETLSTLLSIESPPETRVGGLAAKENASQTMLRILSDPNSKLEILSPFEEVEGETASERSRRVEYSTKWQLSRMKFLQKTANKLMNKDYEKGMQDLMDAELESKTTPKTYFSQQKNLMQDYNRSVEKSLKSFMTLLQAKTELIEIENNINLMIFLKDELEKLRQKNEAVECRLEMDDAGTLTKTSNIISQNCSTDLSKKEQALKYVSHKIAERQRKLCSLLEIQDTVYHKNSPKNEILLTTEFLDVMEQGISKVRCDLEKNVEELIINETLLNNKGMYSKTKVKVHGEPSSGNFTYAEKKPSTRMKTKLSISKLFQPRVKAVRNEIDKVSTMININTSTDENSPPKTSHIKLYIKQARSTDKAMQKKREHFKKRDCGMISRFVV